MNTIGKKGSPTYLYGITNFCGEKVYQVCGFDIVDPKLIKLKNNGRYIFGTRITNQFKTIPWYIIVEEGIMGFGTTKAAATESLSESFYKIYNFEERVERFCRHFEMGKKYPALEFLDWHHRVTGSCKESRDKWAENSIYADQNVTTLQFFTVARNLYRNNQFRKFENMYIEYHTKIKILEEHN